MTSGCGIPESFRAVGEPRAGKTLDGKLCIVYSKNYQINLGGLEKLHPFDINKYAKIYLHLLTDGAIVPEDVFVPEPVTREQLLLIHSEKYLDELSEPKMLGQYLEAAMIGLLPKSVCEDGLLSAFRCTTGGTILASRLALEHGKAINIGGGYHHAEPNRGGGFCVLADMPIAIRVLQQEGLIERALVIDLDVHQGNGTAVCVAEDDRVYTFDMHERDIYPMPKEKNDVDVPLVSGTGDEAYLGILKECLPLLFDEAKPDIVFLQAGVDTYFGDPLASLEMSEEGIVERDAMVFAEAHRRGVPIVMVLGGGYSDDAWRIQYESISRLIRTYGLADETGRAPKREPTIKEKVYTK